MAPPEGKRIAPGVYEHGDELHIDAVEMCEAAGVPATPENQEQLAAAMMDLAAEREIEAEIVDEPGSHGAA